MEQCMSYSVLHNVFLLVKQALLALATVKPAPCLFCNYVRRKLQLQEIDPQFLQPVMLFKGNGTAHKL